MPVFVLAVFYAGLFSILGDNKRKEPTTMTTKITIIMTTLALGAANALAISGGSLLVVTSEALEKEIVLWSATCEDKGAMRFAGKAGQECASDKQALIKRLLEFAKNCEAGYEGGVSADATAEDKAQIQIVEAAWKLQARVARYYAKHFGVAPTDAAAIAEVNAIAKEQAFILSVKPDCTFARVGLLSDESIKWLNLEAHPE
jgi:hypothetical protein